jgi:hypothetical protein
VKYGWQALFKPKRVLLGRIENPSKIFPSFGLERVNSTYFIWDKHTDYPL